MKILILFALLTASCGEPESPDEPIRARILASDGQEGYTFRDVEFQTLRSVSPVKGDIAIVRGGAILSVDNDVEEIIASNDPDAIYSDRGRGLDADYILDGGVVHPKDFTSMSALAIYYNFERTYLYWQNYNNLNLEDFGFTTIYNNPTLKATSGSTSLEVEVKVNAAFLAGVRDLWFFKKSKLAKVPIKMSFGVMAHEFFHSMFDYLVAEKDPTFYDGLSYNQDQLSAINEGLSDFFSILVTGRKEELGETLESLGETRIPPVPWFQSNYPTACGSSFYCLGSVLNSALYEAAETLGMEVVGRYVLDALPGLRDLWLLEREGSFAVYKFVNLIIAAASAEDQAVLCASMTKWFDSNAGVLTCS